MKQVIAMTMALVSVLLIGFITKPDKQISEKTKGNREPSCRFEGTYILKPGGGVSSYGLDMAIPLDPENKSVAIIHDLANYDATLGGLFPTAVRLTTGQGEGMRTGPKTFDYTIHFWALDRNNQRVALIVSSGTKFFSDDCNRYEVPAGTLSVYYPAQDSDNDGFPDPNQYPKHCFPLVCKAQRISIVSPCKQ